MKKITFITLIITTIFYSCERSVTIPIPDNGRKLVVNSLFQADSNLIINLTKSKYILDNTQYNTYSNFPNVLDADISLYQNNILLENLVEIEPGVYKSASFLSENTQYSITINTDDFEQVKATDIIPKAVKINNFEFINYTSDEYGDIYSNFIIEFKDDANIENYYLIELLKEIIYYDDYNYETGEYETETKFLENISIFTNDVNKKSKSNDYEIILNDEFFNGKEHTFSFNSFIYYYYDGGVNENKEKYYVILHSISKDYYLYNVSLNNFLETEGNAFSESVQVYGNIENGFGIFAGISSAVDSVSVAPYVYN